MLPLLVLCFLELLSGFTGALSATIAHDASALFDGKQLLRVQQMQLDTVGELVRNSSFIELSEVFSPDGSRAWCYATATFLFASGR